MKFDDDDDDAPLEATYEDRRRRGEVSMTLKKSIHPIHNFNHV